jgi:hypothetical protein
MRPRFPRPVYLLFVLASVLAWGCGQGGLSSTTAGKLKTLSTLYLDYAASHQGAGPASEESLKAHIRRLDPVQLEAHGIALAKLDELFVSDRDGQPFAVLYGVSLSQISGTSAPLVAHERQGLGERLLVAYANVKVEEIPASQVAALAAPLLSSP